MTDTLLQVFLLVLVGGLAASVGWIDQAANQSFSAFVLRVFMPALLFRAMATVDLAALSLMPILSYLLASSLVYAVVVRLARRHLPAPASKLLPGETQQGRAVAMGLSAAFSNNVMIGIPLVKYFYGPEGLVVLLTVLSMHSLVLLGQGVVGFERALQEAGGSSTQPLAQVLITLAQRTLLNPVVVPIFLGLGWNLLSESTGLAMPLLIDAILAILGQVGPTASLVLLGATVYLARNQIEARGVGPVIFFKLVVLPLVVWATAQLVFQLTPLQVAVLTTMASLPTGSNPYLLAQRYGQGVSISATAVASTTALTAFTLPYVLSLFATLP